MRFVCNGNGDKPFAYSLWLHAEYLNKFEERDRERETNKETEEGKFNNLNV